MIGPEGPLADLSLLAMVDRESRQVLSHVAREFDLPVSGVREILHSQDAAGPHITLVEFFSEPAAGRGVELTQVAGDWNHAVASRAHGSGSPLRFTSFAIGAGPTGAWLLVRPESLRDARRVDSVLAACTALPRPSWMPTPRRPGALHLTLSRSPAPGHSYTELPEFPISCDAYSLAVATMTPYGGIVFQSIYPITAGSR